MTRINTVPPKQLTWPHLQAEYHELPRIFTAVRKLQELPKDIPQQYCLGTGHCKFFYNKIPYLLDRYGAIRSALTSIGVNIDPNKYLAVYLAARGLQDTRSDWWVEWQPEPVDLYLNYARLAKLSNIPTVLKELEQ